MNKSHDQRIPYRTDRVPEPVKLTLLQWLQDGIFPGCVAGLWVQGRWRWRFAGGYAVVKPRRIPMRWTTIFDVASLTKPLITARRILEWAPHRDALLEPLENFPEPSRPTLLDLLQHTAGFRSWAPLYLLTRSAEDRFHRLTHDPWFRPESSRHSTYSCLDYQWLGMFLKKKKLFPRPMRNLIKSRKAIALFRPPQTLRRRIAGTEVYRRHEKEKAEAMGLDTGAYRYHQRANWGRVHDLNAYTLWHGLAGNAGLFSNASGIVRLARWWCRPKLTPHFPRKAPWQLVSPEGEFGLGWHLGLPLMPETKKKWLYHSGFTGVCIALKPENEIIWIFLTNRIHPVFQDLPMNAYRRKLFQLSFNE